MRTRVAEATASVASVADKSRKSYGKTAKIGALWGIGKESVTQLMGIPTAVTLARLLSPTDFGIAAAATFFIQLGKRLGNMGLNTALVRMKDVREEHRASVFVINITIGLLTFAALMLLAPQIGAYYGDPRVTGAVRVASTIFLVNFFGVVEQALLQRDMRFREMAFVEWVNPAIFMPVAIAMAWGGYGYWSLLIGQVVANTASTFAKMYFGRWRPSFRATRRGLAETVPFGLGVYAKRLLTYTAESLDSLIVGGVFGVTGLGFYDKAFNAADNLSNRFSLGSTVLFRIFAIIHEERDRFVRAYTKVVLAGTIVTLPVFAGLIVAAREFIGVVFGEKWLPAVIPFQLLCAAGALRLVSGYASSAIQAKGRIWGEVSRKVAQVALIVTLIIVFRPWGIEGAAFAVFLATLVLTASMQTLVRKVVGLTWAELFAPLGPSVLATIGSTAFIGTVTFLGRDSLPNWMVLLLQMAAGGAFWVAFVLFVPFRSLQDIVDDVLADIVPARVRHGIDWIRARQAHVRSETGS